MTNEQLQLLALIYAANARVVGMHAANQQRNAQGESPAYSEGHFQEEAQHLEHLSVQAINQ
jgi:hypothetical protein